MRRWSTICKLSSKLLLLIVYTSLFQFFTIFLYHFSNRIDTRKTAKVVRHSSLPSDGGGDQPWHQLASPAASPSASPTLPAATRSASIDPNLKSATIQYKNQVTNVGGDRFTTYEEGEDPQVSLFCCCLFLFVSNCILLPKLFSFLQVHDDPL